MSQATVASGASVTQARVVTPMILPLALPGVKIPGFINSHKPKP